MTGLLGQFNTIKLHGGCGVSNTFRSPATRSGLPEHHLMYNMQLIPLRSGFATQFAAFTASNFPETAHLE
ncbi:hypothetical protein [Paenibacillus alginolyticus]|uniref:hypothetical protein n=1 Tax=Paenibacillus alginolyticus TaxID=59839 RepID=UPI002DBA4A55|nr:hypothetical protein [Paenibacillus alginolyticus]MEC0147593.1 hypothetical protein [Paenibacillus alginolyticus]